MVKFHNNKRMTAVQWIFYQYWIIWRKISFLKTPGLVKYLIFEYLGTALLGKEAAMACTVAVEASITAHYNEQLRELHKDGDKYEQLIKTISKFRDDEQEWFRQNYFILKFFDRAFTLDDFAWLIS